MKFSQKLIARITLFLTIIMLAVISVFSYKKIQELIIYDEKVIHTHEVLLKLERLLYTIKDAESGQRGFLISNDSIFLTTFHNARSSADTLISDLKKLTIDNNFQTQKLDSLSILIEDRFDLMNFLVQLGSKQLINHHTLVQEISNGKRKTDKIKALIDRAQGEEEVLLYYRNKQKESLIAITPVITLLLSIFSLTFIIISYYNLTKELKRKINAQRTLEIKVEELNRSNNELEQFAYVASHDLQEPLRKIRSFGDRLLYKHADKLEEDGKINIKKMHDAAVRMQKLIDDLLGFSRLVRSENKFELTNLNEILASVINDLDEIIKSTNAKIEIANLPIINAVPSQMHQLFQNLISNALKFSGKNTIPFITIRYDIVKGHEINHIKSPLQNEFFHRFIIQDNGIGFDEQYLDRIFIIFQRLHGKMEYGGTGIGLAVSKKIVTNHNGYITAQSKVGSGSSFLVYIPDLSKV